MGLIGRIVIDPQTARPGQPVLVKVLDESGQPIDESRTTVTINRAPGAVQYLQFPAEGDWRIRITATAPDGERARDSARIAISGTPVTVSAAARQAEVALLSAVPIYGRPYEAIVTVGSAADPAPARLPSVERPSGPLSRKTIGEMMASMPAARTALARLKKRPSEKITFESRRLARPGGKARFRLESAVLDLDAPGIAELSSQSVQNYDWDFGDGTTATSSGRSVRHDFFAGLKDHSRGFGQFTVTCRERRTGVQVRRTLTLRSAYALCRERGVVVPHVVADDLAHKRQSMLTAKLTLYNLEDGPLTLDRLSIAAHPSGPDDLGTPNPFRNLGAPITVAPRGQAIVALNIPFVDGTPENGQLPFDCPGFSVIYAGTAGRLPVRCTVCFDIPFAERSLRPPPLPKPVELPGNPVVVWPWEPVAGLVGKLVDRGMQVINPGDNVQRRDVVTIDRETGTMAIAVGAAERTLNAAQRRVVDELVDAVYAPVEQVVPTGPVFRRGNVAGSLARGRGTIGFNRRISAFDGPPPPGIVAEGQICDPDNLSEDDLAAADAGQLVCQRTDETIEVTMPGRWMNARKGDLILSPGGTGLIGEMMLNVVPPQIYSHSGIMSRNCDQITHSTGSEERLIDYKTGFMGSGGFEPAVLKYVWPGAITQTVENSIQGELFPDPTSDKSYWIGAFKPHLVQIDSMYVIPPLVVKPDPTLETPQVRAALHAIATDCANNAGASGKIGKYHYRWYSYTDPTPGLAGSPAGADAGWAEGTLPSVCSAYIWIHARHRGAHLESGRDTVETSDLEATDVRGPDSLPAKLRSGTPEGLYLYAADERLAAGEWLFDTVHHMADESSPLASLADAPDNYGNQFLNAFASDIADGQDSEAWRKAKDATAVSPDDILWWDGPDKGGLWGYVEPAIYREPRAESFTVSRWKLVRTRGSVHGRVTDTAGQPAGGAQVEIHDGATTFSASDGTYRLNDVPFGRYELKAQKVIDGVLERGQAEVDLQAADTAVDVQLQQPEAKYRLLKIWIDFSGVDSEWPGSDETYDPPSEYFELELGPDRTTNDTTRQYKWGGELRASYKFTATLLPGNSARLRIDCWLYEGTSENTHDLDGGGHRTLELAPDAGNTCLLAVSNTDEDDDDWAMLSVSVVNARNNV